MHCLGSVAACAAYPEEETFYSLEGTLFHTMLAGCLLDGKDPDTFVGTEMMTPRPELDFTGVVDQEMADHARTCMGFIDTEWMNHPDTDLYVEVTVDPGVPEATGMLDIGLVNMTTKTVHAMDAKYGQGVMVEVKDNEQTRLYLIGLMELALEKHFEKHKTALGWDYFTTIKHSILQPRGRHPDGIFRTQEETGKDLMTFYKQAKAAQKASIDPKAPRTPGAKQCQWCSAKPVCKEAGELVLETAERIFGDGPTSDPIDVGELSEAAVLEILKQGDWIISTINAVKDHQLQRLMVGQGPAGWKAVRGQSKRTYANDFDTTVKELKRCGLKTEEVTELALRTPAAVEKLLKKQAKDGATKRQMNFRWKIFNQVVFKPEGKPKLVPESAPGEAIVVSADELFKPVNDLADLTK
jgi:hypothetical protein